MVVMGLGFVLFFLPLARRLRIFQVRYLALCRGEHRALPTREAFAAQFDSSPSVLPTWLISSLQPLLESGANISLRALELMQCVPSPQCKSSCPSRVVPSFSRQKQILFIGRRFQGTGHHHPPPLPALPPAQ